jgi:hypothetical protein
MKGPVARAVTKGSSIGSGAMERGNDPSSSFLQFRSQPSVDIFNLLVLGLMDLNDSISWD